MASTSIRVQYDLGLNGLRAHSFLQMSSITKVWGKCSDRRPIYHSLTRVATLASKKTREAELRIGSNFSIPDRHKGGDGRGPHHTRHRRHRLCEHVHRRSTMDGDASVHERLLHHQNIIVSPDHVPRNGQVQRGVIVGPTVTVAITAL